MTVIVDITADCITLNGQPHSPQQIESFLSFLASKVGMQLSRKSLLGTFQHVLVDKAPRLC